MNTINIAIYGATSAIAYEVAKIYAKQNYSIYLGARSEAKLESASKELKLFTRAKVDYSVSDANDNESLKTFFKNAVASLGNIDILLVAHGTLPDNEAIMNDTDEILNEMQVNYFSVVTLTTLAAEYFETNKIQGTIAVISSVAGDRARQSNYIYGTAKGAVSLYLQGLRNRLTPSGINVLTIKPGFVDTPMTADVPKNPLFAKPEDVAKGIVKAIKKRKDVIYLPFFWKFIMLIIKSIPEGIFKKMKL